MQAGTTASKKCMKKFNGKSPRAHHPAFVLMAINYTFDTTNMEETNESR